jgi:hypothetical protein
LAPAFERDDDPLGIGGPYEGFGIIVGFPGEAIDRRLEIDDRAEGAAFRRRLVSLAKKPSMALSHEAEVGV